MANQGGRYVMRDGERVLVERTEPKPEKKVKTPAPAATEKPAPVVAEKPAKEESK